MGIARRNKSFEAEQARRDAAFYGLARLDASGIGSGYETTPKSTIGKKRIILDNTFKAPVRVATTVNGVLATAYENGDTVDGVVLATGDRILIKNQTAGSENGIYIVNVTGVPTRALDFNNDSHTVDGVLMIVGEGTTNADTLWILTTNNPITLDTTSLTFTEITGAGGVTFPLNPDINARGNVTGTVTVDLSLTTAHYQEMTLTGNITFVFSNPSADNTINSFVLDMVQDATGGRTVTWPASVRDDPTVGSAADARTLVVVSTVDNGTNYDALIVTGGTQSTKDNLGDHTATEDLKMATFDITNLDRLLLATDSGSFAAGSDTGVLIDASGDMVSNVAINDSHILSINKVDEYSFSASALDMKGNNITGLGDITFNSDNAEDVGTSSVRARDVFTHDVRIGSSGAGVGGARQVYGTSSGLRFNIPTATKFFWDVNNVNKFNMSDSNFTGPNIILSDTLTINDSTTDPSSNGQFTRNVNDVKVFTGGSVLNLSTVATFPTSDSNSIVEGSVDDTKEIRFEVDGLTTATVRVITPPDADFTMAGINIAQTFSAAQTFDDVVKLDMNSDITFKAAIFDIATSLNPVSDFFVERMRFPTNIAPISNAHSISVEALTPDTMMMNVPTNEDWQVTENGAQALGTNLLLIDTSANTLTIGAGLLATRFQGSATINFAITHPATSGSAVGFTTGGSGYTFDKKITFSDDLLSNDGTQNLGITANPWNNIVSDNTLFCSNLKVFSADSDINVFDDLDMQAGAVLDITDISTSAGAGARTLPSNPQDFMKIKVDGVTRLVPFYPV